MRRLTLSITLAFLSSLTVIAGVYATAGMLSFIPPGERGMVPGNTGMHPNENRNSHSSGSRRSDGVWQEQPENFDPQDTAGNSTAHGRGGEQENSSNFIPPNGFGDPPPICFDGQDNDNDGLIDENDPDCPARATEEGRNLDTMADLTVSASGPDSLKQGSIATYSIIVENQGATLAHNVDMSITLAENVTYIGEGNIPCNRTGNTFHCFLTLQPVERRSFSLPVLVNDHQPPADCGNTIVAIEASAFTEATENNHSNNTATTMARLECEKNEREGGGEENQPPSEEATWRKEEMWQQQSTPMPQEDPFLPERELRNNEQQRIEHLQPHFQKQQLRDAIHAQDSPSTEIAQPQLGCFTPQSIWTSDRSLCDENQQKHISNQTVAPVAPPVQERIVQQALHERFIGDRNANNLMELLRSTRDKLLFIQEKFELTKPQELFVRDGIRWLNAQITLYNTEEFTEEDIRQSVESLKVIATETNKITQPAQQGAADIANIIARTWHLLEKTYNSLQVLFREQIPVDPSIITEFQQANTLLIDVQNRCYANRSSCEELNNVFSIIDTMLRELQAIVASTANPRLEEEISQILAQ